MREKAFCKRMFKKVRWPNQKDLIIDQLLFKKLCVILQKAETMKLCLTFLNLDLSTVFHCNACNFLLSSHQLDPSTH